MPLWDLASIFFRFPTIKEQYLSRTGYNAVFDVWMCGIYSHVLAVALGDLVSDGVLVGKVLVVQEVLPALGLVKVPNLG